ncbi:hypothetical protein SPFL3102_02112 [Sporomusaceae bacterium FL31]|nr:hypothetical protein SPFL3101_03746 [Sporomusaceae bacterium FL31]GCE34301.1 hypothetical protein SPFL3102_02112 [Sporomusaceae bacterium]
MEFAVGSIILLSILVFFMPKRLSKQKLYATFGVLSAISLFTDITIGVVYDLFDYTDSAKVELPEHIIDAILSPLFGLVFANFMPRKLKPFILYWLAWLVFSILYEWVAVQVQFLNYKGWSLLHSSIVYVFIYWFIRWHVFFLEKDKGSSE